MIHPHGIEVYLQSTTTGQKYTEYERPDSIECTPNRSERFIEATTNDTFMIVVKLDACFKYYRASGVRVALSFDGSQCPEDDYLNKLKRPGEVYWEENHLCRKVDDEWKRFDLCFGEMAVDKDLQLGKEKAESVASQLGRIKVTLQRGDSRDLRKPKPYDIEDELCLTDVAAREVVLDCGVSHCLRQVWPVNEIDCDAPVTSWTFTRLRGAHGRPYEFDFIYRSRVNLQRMGIIPLGPIVEPGGLAVSGDAANNDVMAPPMSPQTTEQTNSTDRPRSQTTSFEPQSRKDDPLSRLTPTTIASPQIPSIKREAEEGPTWSSIPPKRLKTIDLTEDSPPPSQRPFRAESIQVKAEPYGEDLDEDDIHMELRKIQLQQRLKRLQRARVSRS